MSMNQRRPRRPEGDPVPTLAEVTPVDAAFFEKAGASPIEAASLAAQHESLSGRRGPAARAEMSIAARDAPPPLSAPPAPVATQAAATAALEQHQATQLQAEMDATFAPPANPTDYRIPEPSEGHNDQTMADTSALQTALHQERMPQMVVESIGKSLAETTRVLARESPSEQATRDQAADARLRGLWGKEYEANLAAVDTMLGQMSARSPIVKQFLGMNARALARNPLSVDLLLQVAKNRAGNLR